MSVDLRDYSAVRIGQVWTQEDHEYLLKTLALIDRTCIGIWNRIRNETRDAPKRLDELISTDVPPPRGNPDALELPFDGPPDDTET